MSTKERDRKAVLSSVASGSMTLEEAALALDLSRRQATRIYGRYCLEGDAGLVQLDGSHHRCFGPDGAEHCVTQFGKVCRRRGITLILARSAQVKRRLSA